MHCWQKNTAGGEQVTGPPSSLTWKPLPAPPHAPSSARRPQSDITSRFPLAFRRTLCVTTTEERGENGAIRHGCPARRRTSQGREEASRRERGDQTRMPCKTAYQPRAGRRPPAARGSGLWTVLQHPDPEVSTSSHTQDQVTCQRGWARDPSSSLSHQLCDARRQGM